jgi:hypothetical protein
MAVSTGAIHTRPCLLPANWCHHERDEKKDTWLVGWCSDRNHSADRFGVPNTDTHRTASASDSQWKLLGGHRRDLLRLSCDDIPLLPRNDHRHVRDVFQLPSALRTGCLRANNRHDRRGLSQKLSERY